MKGYLLDTHALLYWLVDPAQLDPGARRVIADGGSVVYVSAGAIWEMAIKKRLGRLDFPTNLDEVLRNDHIEVLAITLPHALAVSDLPMHHEDPFDRLMIAQARIEDLVLVSRDSRMAQYDVRVVAA